VTAQTFLLPCPGSSAVLSDDGRYRYELRRRWGDRPGTIAWIMLNPSTADASQNDPTIRRCIGFTAAWGYDSLCVVNLFALRATDPRELTKASDPIGPDNDDWLYRRSGTIGVPAVIAAWGARSLARDRARSLIERGVLPRHGLSCVGATKDGHPAHPLFVPAGRQPAPWRSA
jgi:hypothetical protein